MIDRKFLRVVFIFAAVLAVGGLAALPAHAQGEPTPPDLNVCNGVTCETLPDSVCSDAGFKITLTNFLPGNTQNSGTATYTYEIYTRRAGVYRVMAMAPRVVSAMTIARRAGTPRGYLQPRVHRRYLPRPEPF